MVFITMPFPVTMVFIMMPLSVTMVAVNVGMLLMTTLPRVMRRCLALMSAR